METIGRGRTLLIEVVRMKRVIAAVAVLAAVVGVGIWWQHSRAPDEVLPPVENPPTAAAAASAVAEPGYRLVGRGAAVVEVPQAFGHDGVRCGTALADTVVFYPDVVLLCALLDHRSFSTVLIAPYAIGPTYDAVVEPGFQYKQFSSKPDDAFIVVRSKDKAVFDRIAASYRQLGPEWTTVPELFFGNSAGTPGVNDLPDDREIELRLKRFGLKVEWATLDLRSPTHGPRTSEPVVGSVVKKGSTVTIIDGH